ncbi:hypothetical protein [uncultured Kocuria sp.]|uniref:hypothetical protein n=1 Tax=uncultured Kocuria sp. TaxID=259305 RepID=UPI0026183472|nr:hypothetical protein [uncultured Kocuria sp.]
MSTAPPDELRADAAGSHTVPGPDIPERPNHAQFTDACFQDGLTDAARGIFDKYSFTSQAPTTFEHRCSSWLGFALGKAIDQRHEDLYTARDITARAEADLVRAQGRLRHTEEELVEVEGRIDETRAILDDPGHPLYEPLAEMLSSTEPVDQKAAKKSRKNLRPAFHTVRRIALWFWTRPYLYTLLWLALVGGEVGLIYGVTQLLGDSQLTGQLMALSVAGLAVAIASFAIPPLLDPQARRSHKTLGTIAVTLYVVTIVALGWLRYLTTRPDVLDLAEDAADRSVVDIVLPWFGDALLYSMWTALPLALTLAITLLENRWPTKRSTGNHPSEAELDRLRAENAERAEAEKRASETEHQLQHQRAQLITHLRGLRLRRQVLQDSVVALRAEETHARATRENVMLNELAIDQRTRAHLQSLPEMIREGFLRYLQGLEQAMADPTVTAHLHEAAETYMARYERVAATKVAEYLTYLDENPLAPPAMAGNR